MDIFSETNYKSAIRTKLSEVSQFKRNLNLKKVAERVPMQYTYLSKILNDDHTHVNEDHLHAIANILGFLPEEADFLFILRSIATSSSEGRKAELLRKIEQIKKAKKIKASLQEFNSLQLQKEMEYLFDPLAVIIYVSLHIDEYFRNPKLLCSLLGINILTLKKILTKLHQTGYIEFGKNEFHLTKLNRSHIHYSIDHPLMRVHQNLLRHLSTAQLLKTPEQDKHSFQVTFSADPETFEKIKEEFNNFLGKIEKLVLTSQSLSTYQLSFDLFKWL